MVWGFCGGGIFVCFVLFGVLFGWFLNMSYFLPFIVIWKFSFSQFQKRETRIS